MKKRWISYLLMALVIPFLSHADVVEITNMDSGAYDSSGFHNPADQSYEISAGGNRNFFVFDMDSPSLAGHAITSAVFRVYTYDASGGIFGFGNTYTVRGVSSDVSTLTAGGSGKLDVYSSLADGPTYGTIDLQSSMDNQYIDIALGVDTLNSLNAAGGLWALGGSLSFAGTGSEFQSSVFNSGNKLILGTTTIPEPTSAILMGVFSGFGFYIRRRFRR